MSVSTLVSRSLVLVAVLSIEVDRAFVPMSYSFYGARLVLGGCMRYEPNSQ